MATTCACEDTTDGVIDRILSFKLYPCNQCQVIIKLLVETGFMLTCMDNDHIRVYSDENVRKVCELLRDPAIQRAVGVPENAHLHLFDSVYEDPDIPLCIRNAERRYD
jgi:hypothetical protein